MEAVCFVSDEKKQFAKTTISFAEDRKAEMQLVKIYPEVTKQSMNGFGGAATEAAAYTVSRMSPKTREQVMELYFGETGNRYNFCRTHIQSCDFALDNYAYIKDPEDTELNTFSLERDQKYIIPMIQGALEKNKNIRFLASPWSPPSFMKSNGEMNHGGTLKKEFYQMWADVMAKYAAEYKKMGICIDTMTVQNEPKAVQTWDSCVYTGEEEGVFASQYLRPALDKQGLSDVKIAIWDHNKDVLLDRATETFAVKGTETAVSAVGFHWYSGDHFEEVQEVFERFPEKELIFTEGCVEYSRFENNNQVKNAEMYAHDMIGNINHGMSSYLDWNLVLDEKGGPNHVGNYCDAPVMYLEKEDKLDIKLSYYYIGHFSRFVQKGAKRVLVSRYTDGVEAAGFINPDRSRVLVLLNRKDDTQKFQVSEDGMLCDVVMQPHCIMTLCW